MLVLLDQEKASLNVSLFFLKSLNIKTFLEIFLAKQPVFEGRPFIIYETFFGKSSYPLQTVATVEKSPFMPF